MKRLFEYIHKKMNSKKGYTMIELLTASIIVILISVMISTGITVGARVQKESTFVSNSDMLSGTLNTAISDLVRYADCIYSDADLVDGLVTGNVKITNTEYAVREGYLFIDDDGLMAINKNGGDLSITSDVSDLTAADVGYLVSKGVYSNLHIKDFEITYNPTNRVFSGKYMIFVNENSKLKKSVTFTYRSVKK